jgi:hypothetical protein
MTDVFMCTAGHERFVSPRFVFVSHLCLYIIPDPNHYKTGAAVLSHSLRDNGTNKKLAVLVTPDCLRANTITQLKVSTHFHSHDL